MLRITPPVDSVPIAVPVTVNVPSDYLFHQSPKKDL